MTASAMTPPSPAAAAVYANQIVIRQGIALLAVLGGERFVARIPLCFHSSIGGHLRHIIEHYQSFLRGLDDGEIDYEDRPRDPLIESNPDYAADILEEISARLHAVGAARPDRGLQLRAETTEGVMTGTSVLRELEFLLSHTIHHYALVAVMARLQGCEPEATFGVAPSTIKFQQSQAGCAR
jgi:uncharacterized damage-inducible protein DinB